MSFVKRKSVDALKVRTGTPADLDAVMSLALAACEDNELTNASPRKLLEEIWPSLHLDHGIMGLIGQAPLEAAILLRVDSMWYSEAPCLIERSIFVDPKYRAAKGGRACLLCDWARSVRSALDMPLLIGIISSERTKGKVRLYERQFGPPAGAYWIVGAHTGHKAA